MRFSEERRDLIDMDVASRVTRRSLLLTVLAVADLYLASPVPPPYDGNDARSGGCVVLYVAEAQ